MFWVSSDLNSGKKVRVFHLGGVLGKLRCELRKERFFIFRGGGVFWVRPHLDSGNNFNLGGVFWNQIPEQGCFGEIWSKFSGSLAGWCITDSLSHTTYVETNNIYI